MDCIVTRSALLDAASLVDQVVPSRSPHLPLMCQKLECRDGKLIVSGASQSQYVTMEVGEVQIEENGIVLIPSDKLLKSLSDTDAETIRIDDSRDDQYIHILAGNAHFKLYGQPPEKYSPFPTDHETQSAEVSVGVLIDLLKLTEFAAGMCTIVAFQTNGVRLDIPVGNKITAVGTDGRAIAVAMGKLCAPCEQAIQVTVPTASIKAIKSAPFDPSEPVVIRVGRMAEFCQDGISIMTTLREGQYPAFDAILREEASRRIKLNRAAFAASLRQAQLVATEESKAARFSFNATGLTLDAHGVGAGEATITHACNMDGAPIAIGLNVKLVLQGLSVMAGDEIEMTMSSPDRPGIFVDGSDFTYGVMPVTLAA